VDFWFTFVSFVSSFFVSIKFRFLSKKKKKSVLCSIPSYHLSLFRIPIGVTKKIEKIMRDFLWNIHGEGKKIHLLSWEVVSRSRDRSGLRIGNIVKKNLALLGK